MLNPQASSALHAARRALPPCVYTDPVEWRDGPSGCGFIALLEVFRDSGGTAPGDVVARLLEDHQRGDGVSLAKSIHQGHLFGFEWRNSLWVPMFQFDADDLTIKPAVQAVRAALPELGSGWAVAVWFASRNELLEGRRPVDLLEDELERVLDAARACASG